MTVHFIGAGPGARRPHHRARPRAHRALPGLPLCRLARAAGDPVLVPARRAHRRHGAARSRRDHGGIRAGARAGRGRGAAAFRRSLDLERLGEQLRRLDALGIPYTITPGVPAFAAAAAALGRELTLPEVGAIGGAHPHLGPRLGHAGDGTARAFAQTKATLAIHLSIHVIEQVVEELAARLRRRLPGRGGLARLVAGRARAQGHARQHRRAGASREAGAHGADPGRARARG